MTTTGPAPPPGFFVHLITGFAQSHHAPRIQQEKQPPEGGRGTGSAEKLGSRAAGLGFLWHERALEADEGGL